ncbi:MAG TPA: tetratricopeptide repeat protein [Candidatus Babeliales bacterium]|nr:tetratricopeptide repeat protein [Candidatus Babeliales bacterium]
MKKLFALTLCAITGIAYANQFHNYFWANYQQFGGNREETQKWYNHIFSNKNHSLLNNKGYLHFLSDSGDYKKIIELMPKLEKPFEKDPDVQLIFITALRKVGKKNDADSRLIALSRTFKQHTELVFNAAETLVERKELKNALALLDDYLNSAPRRPNNFIFYFLKGKIYMQLKDYTLARTFLQQCIDAHPRFPQGWLLKAMLEEQAGQLDQAIKGFSSYLELNGPNKQIEQHLLGLVLKQKASHTKTNTIASNRPCLDQALMLFENRHYDAALAHINTCLARNETDSQMRLLKIQILTAMQSHTEAIKLLVSWSAQEPGNPMWQQILHLLSRTDAPIEKVINAFTSLATQQPHNLATNLYLADLHTRAGNTTSAITYHKKALALSNEPQIKARILFQLSTLHYEQAQYDQMLASLAELEKVNPQFAPALNLKAYYYATEGKNLAQANALFEKAYALDTGNPHLLDTKAVILYKEKKYEHARTLLEPLAEKLPQDSSVLIHLAKTYAKLGKQADARKVIDRAQQNARTPYEKKTSAILAYSWNKQQA